MGAKLNDKQAMFCKEYIVDLNATQAAIRAGYSEKTSYSIGSELLKKPELQQELQSLMAKRAEKVQIDANYVLTNIKEIGEHCMKKEDYREKGALKAQELLGKHLKVFGADSETVNKVTVVMPSITVDGKPKEYDLGS